MTKILGKSVATAAQMSAYLLTRNPNPLFSRRISVKEFCQLFIDICSKEEVRGDIAFVQACKETANFKFGGDVKYTQNNFAGIGATGNGVCGCVFKDIETGILAQAQHLKTYATIAALNEPCVDPRRTTWFVNTKGGTSPDVEGLAGTWAVPGYSTNKYSSLTAANAAKDSYGYQIVNILNEIIKISVKEETIMSNPIIALDAGHGQYTAGKRVTLTNIDPTNTREWFLNDRIVDKVEIRLQSYNCTVLRVNDTTGKIDTSLAARVATANNANATIYLSMHHNAGANGKAGVGGTVVFYYPTGTCKADATKLYNEIIKYTGLKGDRSTPVADGKHLYVINSTSMPAFLVENGFMDSPTDVPVILTEEHAEKTAIAVTNFLVNHLNLTLKVGATAPSTNIISTNASASTQTNTSSTLKAGDKITLNSNNVYGSSASTANYIKRSGTYYIWSNQIVNNRIRITNAQNRVGVTGQITGWVNVSDISVTTSTTNSSTTSTATSVTGNYNLIFNAIQYVNLYPDLKAAFGTNATALLNHFKTYGMKEGRKGNNAFDVKVYKESNPDLQKAFGDSGYEAYFQHYLTYGYKENRKCV